MNQLLPFVSFRQSRRALKRGCQEERLGGRDSPGVWDGRGHPAVFNTENQQGRAGQVRELCSIENKKLNFKSLIIYTLVNITQAIMGLLHSPGNCAEYSVMTYMEKEL